MSEKGRGLGIYLTVLDACKVFAKDIEILFFVHLLRAKIIMNGLVDMLDNRVSPGITHKHLSSYS